MIIIKIIFQFILIYIIFQIGNLISKLIQPIMLIPGSIIGMVILFILLSINIIKLENVQNVSDLFLKNMGLFFIPFGVSILKYLDVIKDTWIQLTIVLIISCILVMFVTSKTVDFFINRENMKES